MKFRLQILIVFLILFTSKSFAGITGAINQGNDDTDWNFIMFWSGTDPKMRMGDLAAYCAPIFWFSPDEPELNRKEGKEILIPSAFPFETQIDSPVVYYQVREILVKEDVSGIAYIPDTSNINNSIIDLSKTAGFNIDYNHYYKFEVGLGKHNHDTEQVQFKIYVHQKKDAEGVIHYYLVFLQATAKAHALEWYDNIYSLDSLSLNPELVLPFHILVEEGKHASCSDMNGDGYYTPGYDVNVRTNDAWGLRDVIRTGELFSPEFKGWMAKVRRKEHRVFPPLPIDSPLRERLSKEGIYAPDNSIYQLRPMPSPDKAVPDYTLKHDMDSYYIPGWPLQMTQTSTKNFIDWWESGNFIKSVAIAARVNEKWGLSISFPLLIIKNIEAPMIGGWLVNRIYLQDDRLRDFGYNILYTPSASRFLDPYLSFGFEIDKFDVPGNGKVESRTDFVFETGIKIRANMKYSPLKFLTAITDFWGVRLGIKNRGFMAIDHLSYLFEIGAGVW